MNPSAAKTSATKADASARRDVSEFDSTPALEQNRTSTTLSVIVPVYNEQFLVEASLARLEVLGESSLLERIREAEERAKGRSRPP